MAERFDQAFWDERYRSQSSLWSGKPNLRLVTEASGLVPGTALDIGCGEGADAIWLAERGWQVTAVDVSAVAIERAGGHAEKAGPAIAGRIGWVRADVTAWDPGLDRYDLVSAQYMHLPGPLREALFRALAASVRPGGTLLVVGHHVSDLEVVPRPNQPDLFFVGADIVALLEPAEWEIVTDTAAPGPPPIPTDTPSPFTTRSCGPSVHGPLTDHRHCDADLRPTRPRRRPSCRTRGMPTNAVPRSWGTPEFQF